MRKYVILLLVLAGFSACSDDDGATTVVYPSATGTMQDKNGNTYAWVRIDTLDWMAENLRSGIRWYRQGTASNPKFSYNDSTECAGWFEVFGNYYSYSEALAQCPDGWRLPTDEDWKCLERACGMSRGEVDGTGWRGDAAGLLTGMDGDMGINLSYGGELTAFYTSYVELYHIYDYGLYWSSTIDTSQVQQCAFIRKITPSVKKVQRVSSPTTGKWISVRYVRSAQ